MSIAQPQTLCEWERSCLGGEEQSVGLCEWERSYLGGEEQSVGTVTFTVINLQLNESTESLLF